MIAHQEWLATQDAMSAIEDQDDVEEVREMIQALDEEQERKDLAEQLAMIASGRGLL